MTATWRSSYLGDICRFQAGSAFPQDAQGAASGAIPFIKVSDMNLPQNMKRIIVANNWVDEETASRLRLKPLPAGAVVFAKIGEALKAERLRTLVMPTAIDNNMMGAIPNTERIDARFLLFLLETVHLATWAEGSALPYLRQQDLLRIPVSLPPMHEQRAIAETLGALDDKIESNRRAIALMEDLVRAHFDRLFDVGFDDNGVPLSTLVVVNPKRKLPDGESSTYVGMSSLPEFSAESYEWETKPAGSGARFANGDVLMARITPCLENGKTAVVDMLGPDDVAWGSTEYIVLAPQENIKTPWIYCLSRHEEVRSFAIRSMTGSSGRQRFKADRFDQYKVTPPDTAALDEFNAIAEPLFSRMTQLRDESLRAIALRDTLLPELLCGRIRVPEAREVVQEAAG